MNAQQLDGHKKALGILYVISALITISGILILNAVLSIIFSFAFKEIDPDEQRIMEMILAVVQYLPVVIILFFALPTLIAGIGLLAKKTWATIFALIVGCLKLFSFPIGTAIGIYAIWIYAEDQKINRANTV